MLQDMKEIRRKRNRKILRYVPIIGIDFARRGEFKSDAAKNAYGIYQMACCVAGLALIFTT